MAVCNTTLIHLADAALLNAPLSTARRLYTNQYRYVTEEYINETVDFDNNNKCRDGISQADLLGAYQILQSGAQNCCLLFLCFNTQEDLEWLARLKLQDQIVGTSALPIVTVWRTTLVFKYHTWIWK